MTAQIEDPFALFSTWFDEARTHESDVPDAMVLSTIDSDGLPNGRVVLLKDFDESGFRFYTNYESTKGQELAGHARAALTFHWKSLKRQVRLRGLIEKTSAEDSDAYFATRPAGSQLGAWASRQSTPLGSREQLTEEVGALAQKYDGQTIPRPTHWGGYCLAPLSIEFWADGEFRLHDRFLYTRTDTASSDWTVERLYP